MKIELIIITDYKNNFGSKWKANPYRSGLDKDSLKKLFEDEGISIEYINYSEIRFNNTTWKDKWILFSSSEDTGLYYKSYIEDIVLGLHLSGANLIPGFEFLKAHENKVFMEILRQTKIPSSIRTMESLTFGSIEEAQLLLKKGKLKFPMILKNAQGAMSKSVYLIKEAKDLIKIVKQVGRTMNNKSWLKETVRKFKYIGYKNESRYQKKFILQPFIEGLSNDWKVLIYGDKIFILKRQIKKGDFKASGSGLNYSTGLSSKFPIQFLNFVYNFYQHLNVPHISLDFAFDGVNPYIFEFQCIHFGTSTHFKSKEYYQKTINGWELRENTFSLESVYVSSILQFISANENEKNSFKK